MNHSPLEAALFYAARGWKIVPILSNSKLPASAHAVNDASGEEAQIRAWYEQHPEWNVAIAAGAPSGIAVIDIDPRNGGEESWEAWQTTHGAISGGAMQLTAGGGQHYLVEYDSEIRSRKMAQGIDYLSDGKYFLVYPSKIESREYHWEASADPFDSVAPAPLPAHYKTGLLVNKKEAQASGSGDLIVGNRNSGLASLAGTLRAAGMGVVEIYAGLSITNDLRCDPPLPASELRQIVQSVCRYEPNGDVAADTALGSAAVDALPSRNTQQGDYFLTRADCFLTQPSPLPWVIKGWLPAGSTAMIYGESGVGKTFVALDIACSVASGTPWCGIQPQPGVVVYLAGEGNYGLRQRIAAWAKKRGITDLRNLLVSNKPIDLDARGSAEMILAAIREITTDPVALIFIDTVNNHMSGDENSAQDTRTMLNACHTVALATGATTALVHHTGLADGAQQRARGSSAWRGALDTSLLICAPKKDEGMKIMCTKMKDAPAPDPLFGVLASVPLGWFDDDGQEIRGACFEQSGGAGAALPARDSKMSRYLKMLTTAWLETGAERKDSLPFLSKAALIDYLAALKGVTRASAAKHVTGDGRMVSDLLIAGILRADSWGFSVIANDVISTLNLVSKTTPKNE